MIQYQTVQDIKHIMNSLDTFQACFPDLKKRVEDLAEYCQKLSEYATVLLMFEKDELIGFCAYYANDVETKTGYISLIGILPAFRNAGYGSRLLLHCIEKMSSAGMLRVKLEVDLTNTAAQSYYKKNGFKYSGKARPDSIYLEKAIERSSP